MTFPVTDNPVFKWADQEFTFSNMRTVDNATLFGPAVRLSAITPATATPLPGGPTRAIISQAAGTITGYDAFGNAVTALPLQEGWNNISLAGVDSIATTTAVWAVY